MTSGRAACTAPVLYARDVSNGEPSVPKTAGGARGKRPEVKKKAGGAGAKEPRVTTSGGGAATKWVPRTQGSRCEADVLDRLNRLAEPVPSVEPALDSVALPPIVDADPTYPPLERPSRGQTELDEAPAAARARSHRLEDLEEPHVGELPTALATVVDSPVEALQSIVVSESSSLDAPTELLAPGVIDAPPIMPVVPVLAPLPSLDELLAAGAGEETGDESSEMVLPIRPLQRPVTFKRGKPRVRRVTRVVRHVDTWSVFKVALVFNVILYMVCLVAGVLLWNVAHATGTVDNVEKFFEQFGWETFQFKGGEIYHSAWIAGLFGAIGLTGFAVLLATLFNLITDLVGGVRVSVLEEEVVARAPMRSSDRGGTDSA